MKPARKQDNLSRLFLISCFWYDNSMDEEKKKKKKRLNRRMSKPKWVLVAILAFNVRTNDSWEKWVHFQGGWGWVLRWGWADSNPVKYICHPYQLESTLTEKNLLPKSKFLPLKVEFVPFREDSILEGFGIYKSKQCVAKIVSLQKRRKTQTAKIFTFCSFKYASIVRVRHW